MAKMINITVLFFANLREIIGKKEISLEIPETTSVMQFKTIIGEAYPELIPALDSTLISVNKEFGFDDDLLPKDAQVALFPPVSGGREC
jgi:molybdopterin converting factor small subunit